MIQISAKSQKDLICLCGLCDHDMFDTSCLYNQIVDKKNPSEELQKKILTLMRKEIALNAAKPPKTTMGTAKTKTTNGKTSKKNKRK